MLTMPMQTPVQTPVQMFVPSTEVDTKRVELSHAATKSCTATKSLLKTNNNKTTR